jgi:hypothetical protein
MKTYWIEADNYQDACELARDNSATVTVRPIVFVPGQHAVGHILSEPR